MTPRLNVNLTDDTKVRLETLKRLYENKFGTELSWAAVVRIAIHNALVAETKAS